MFVKLSLLWFYFRLDQHGYMEWAVYALTFYFNEIINIS